MSNILKDMTLSTDFDTLYIQNDNIDQMGEIPDDIDVKDLINKLNDVSDDHVPQSKLIKRILTEIIARIGNIEILVDQQWKETSFKINNVDSIDNTITNTINVNYTNGNKNGY